MDIRIYKKKDGMYDVFEGMLNYEVWLFSYNSPDNVFSALEGYKDINIKFFDMQMYDDD